MCVHALDIYIYMCVSAVPLSVRSEGGEVGGVLTDSSALLRDTKPLAGAPSLALSLVLSAVYLFNS